MKKKSGISFIEDSTDLYGYATGVNLVSLIWSNFNSNLVFAIIYWGVLVYVFYKAIKYMSEEKQYKQPLAVIGIVIGIYLIFMVIKFVKLFISLNS